MLSLLKLQFLIHFHSSFQDLCSEIDDSKIDMHWDEIEIQSEIENENEIKISAQKYLIKFYTALGFKAIGNEYLEDGIPHIAMIRK